MASPPAAVARPLPWISANKGYVASAAVLTVGVAFSICAQPFSIWGEQVKEAAWGPVNEVKSSFGSLTEALLELPLLGLVKELCELNSIEEFLLRVLVWSFFLIIVYYFIVRAGLFHSSLLFYSSGYVKAGVKSRSHPAPRLERLPSSNLLDQSLTWGDFLFKLWSLPFPDTAKAFEERLKHTPRTEGMFEGVSQRVLPLTLLPLFEPTYAYYDMAVFALTVFDKSIVKKPPGLDFYLDAIRDTVLVGRGVYVVQEFLIGINFANLWSLLAGSKGEVDSAGSEMRTQLEQGFVIDEDTLNQMKVVDLRAECDKRGVPSSGAKPALVRRLSETSSTFSATGGASPAAAAIVPPPPAPETPKRQQHPRHKAELRAFRETHVGSTKLVRLFFSLFWFYSSLFMIFKFEFPTLTVAKDGLFYSLGLALFIQGSKFDDIVAGLIMQLDPSFKTGDMIAFSSFFSGDDHKKTEGKVIETGLRHVVVERNGEKLFIPHSVFAKEKIFVKRS